MIKKTMKFITVTAVACVLSGAAYANIFDWDSNDKDIENAKMAKITIVEAINKVTRKHDGFVITATLEEKEADQLVYEIDLIQNDKEVEIWVDAKTGEMSELMAD